MVKTEFYTIRFAVDGSFFFKFNYLDFVCTVCIAYITRIFQSVWHGVASYKYNYSFIFICCTLSYVLAARWCQSWKITNSTFWYFSYILLFIAQSCQTLCDPLDFSPPGSSVHGASPDKNSGVVAMPSSSGSSQPRDHIGLSCVAGRFFTVEPQRKR